MSANSTVAPDVIDVVGAPCDFTFTNSVAFASPEQTAIAQVTQPLTINGNGARFVRSGANNFRFLRNASALTVNDVTFVNGRLAGTGSQGVFGAGIYNAGGTLTLTNSHFQGNAVSGSTNSRGGAVFTLGGPVTINGGSFTANGAATLGGALATFTNIFVNPAVPAVVTITGTSMSQNVAGSGGAIATDAGSLTLDGVELGSNTTPTTAITNLGGAIFSQASAITVADDSALSSNTAVLGGGIYAAGGSVTVTDSSVADNTGTVAGGGIITDTTALTVLRSTLAENASTVSSSLGNGGGLYVKGGTLLVEDSTLRANTVPFAGGGLYTQNATGTIRRTTLRDNHAEFTNGAGLVAGGHLTVENATVNANTATTFANGGLAVIPSATSGSVPGEAGRLDVVSTTLADNGKQGSTAPGNQLAVNGRNSANQDLGAELHVTDTIVSDADGGAPLSAPCATANGGVLADEGGNLEWPGTSCGFDTSADPLLGPLTDNGGPTLTRMPQPASPAIDLGGASCPDEDQRGVDRPDGDGCDTGSVETPAPQTSANGPASPTNDPEVTFSSDDAQADFECQIDGGSWDPCTSPFSPALDDGEHTVRVRAINDQGYADRSPASVTFVVDTTGPVVDITSVQQQPGLPATAKAVFSVDGTATDVECRVDDGTFADCSSPYTTGPLADGGHTLTVRATDALGNVGSDSQAFTIDTTAPNTTITSGPSGTIYDPAATFTFTSTKAGSTFECRLDAGAWAPCTSPKTYSGFAPGTHTFAVRAKDGNGITDPTPATRTFTYKTCLVLITIGGQPICI